MEILGRSLRLAGGLTNADGGVPDAKYVSGYLQICSFLEDVGSMARELTPLQESVRLSAENRGDDAKELARDMRTFNWDDRIACRRRYALLFNFSQRHTRCVTNCLRDGRCRFDFPHEENDSGTIAAHPFVAQLTYTIEDWHIFALPPTMSPPR